MLIRIRKLKASFILLWQPDIPYITSSLPILCLAKISNYKTRNTTSNWLWVEFRWKWFIFDKWNNVKPALEKVLHLIYCSCPRKCIRHSYPYIENSLACTDLCVKQDCENYFSPDDLCESEFDSYNEIHDDEDD